MIVLSRAFISYVETEQEKTEHIMKHKKISVHPLAFVFFFGLLLSDRSSVALVTVLAAFLHECGHIGAAYFMKIPFGNIQLDFLGARIEIKGQSLTYGEEWLLAAAGPLTSLLCAVLAAPFWKYWTAASVFSCASFLLGCLNLLPIRTFDGGRMLETVLLYGTSIRVARVVMNICSFVALFLLWAFSVYFLLRANDGLSLLCFSMSLLTRFFEEGADKNE